MDQGKETEITRGWTYQVNFGYATTMKSVKGVFKGYSMMGSDTAVVIEASAGLTYIPVNKISSIVLLEQKGEPAPQKKKEEPGVYYG